MKIQDLKPDAPVNSLEGTLVKVYKPSAPSPVQQEKNIHRQDVVLSDGTGEVKLELMSASQHLPLEAEGKQFAFVGMKDSMTCREYNGKLSVSVWDRTQMSTIKGDAPAQSAQTGEVGELDALAAHHRACYDAVKRAYADLDSVAIEGFATTLFIETKNRYKQMQPARAAAPTSPAAPAPVQEKPQDDSLVDKQTGKTVEDMTDNELIDLRIRINALLQQGSKAERVIAFKEAAAKEAEKRDMSLELVVDEVLRRAVQKYGQAATDAAFDGIKLKKKTDGATNLFILSNMKGFYELVEANK